MTTAPNSAILDPVTNPVLTVAPQSKEDTTMSGATNKITALYCRLSQEDARLGESLSIENQKAILLEYAKKNHFPNPVFFVDDGYSGTNYDRPGFQSMLVEIEAGRVGIVITKDLSRLGRNSALTGLYTNFTFPQYGVRYIAINDNYDTIDPNSVNNDFAGIKNWFNEFYARDTSRKIRAVQKAKGERGVPLTGNALLYISLLSVDFQGASAGAHLIFVSSWLGVRQNAFTGSFSPWLHRGWFCAVPPSGRTIPPLQGRREQRRHWFWYPVRRSFPCPQRTA